MEGDVQGHFAPPQSSIQFLFAQKHVRLLFSPLFSNGAWKTLSAHCQLMLEMNCFCENTIHLSTQEATFQSMLPPPLAIGIQSELADGFWSTMI